MIVRGAGQDALTLSTASAEGGADLSPAEYERMLQYLHALIYKPVIPPDVPESLTAHREAEDIRNALSGFRDALKLASRGDFSYQVTTRGYLSGLMKSLQSHLNQMAWLTRRMANGDLDQRLDFMGTIADSFNDMADRLSRTLEDLRQREEHLQRLTVDLKHEVEIRRETEKKLRSEEERWLLAMECSRDGLWDINLESGEPPYYSPRLFELTKQNANSPDVFKNWDELFDPNDNEARALFCCLFSDNPPKSFRLDHKLRCGDGSYRWFMTRGMTLTDPVTNKCSRLIGVMADIQERKEREELFSHQATHDALTGLPNRILFDQRLERDLEFAKRNGSHLAVIMADLDKFKEINDTFGHHAGDTVLIEVATRFQKSMRGSDTVSRFGGDEFALLFSFGRNEWQSITRMLSRTMRSLQRPIALDGKDGTESFVVTASLGMCIYPGDGNSPRELMKRADEAMYYSKVHGRNACAFWKQDGQHTLVQFGEHYMDGGRERKEGEEVQEKGQAATREKPLISDSV